MSGTFFAFGCSMPLGYVSKRFEELVTSGKANSSMFSNFVHDQRVH